MKPKHFSIASLFVCAIAGTTLVHGQVTFGTITGTVTDSVGAVVPGVPITITNEETGISKTVTSGESGTYEATHLTPGLYTVTARQTGFKRFRHEDLELAAMTTVRADISLEVGEVVTEVTVSAAQPVIETDSPTIAQSRSFRQLRDLPINVRGTATLYQWTWLTPTAVQGGGSRRTFGGSRASMTFFNVDGISSNSTAFGNQLADLNPSQESLQELRFDYINPKAEYGEIGNVTAITKSGTNSFHGTAFWYNIHSALSARNFFATTRGPLDPQTGDELFTQNNQVGGSLGGPIIRNRLFFFVSHEYNRDGSPAVITPSVPTLKMRQGDFSELLNLGKPIVVKNPYTGQPFPGNQIPPEMLNSGTVAWQERFYPAPNFGPLDSFNKNYRNSFSQLAQDNKFVNRVDFRITDSNTLYWRLMLNRLDDGRLSGGLPPESTGFRNLVRKGPQIALSDTWTLSPTLVNEFRASFSRRAALRRGSTLPGGEEIKGQPLVDVLGIQGLPNRPDAFTIPDLRITGFQRVQVGPGNDYYEDTYQISDNLTWIKGRHTSKMGFGWLPQKYTGYRPAFFGRYDFKNTFSGFSYADYLMGLPQTTFRESVRPTVYQEYYWLNFFFQDDYKVTNRLTLNYGLRWEYNSPHADKHDIFSSFDPVTGSIVVPTQEARNRISPAFPIDTIPVLTAGEAGFPGRGLRHPDKNNFAPRFGFAYRPFRNGLTVIRGGYGVFFENFSAGIVGNQIFSGPFETEERFRNRVSGGVPELTLQNPYLETGSIGTMTVRFNSKNMINPYTQQWNLTVERDIGFNMGLRLSYVGAKTTQINYRRNINQLPASTVPFGERALPYPLYSELRLTENGGNQIYNAFIVNLERRMSRGLYFQTNWTWAKNIADVDDDGNVERGTIIENQFCRACERGDTRYTPRHRMVANLIWELPIGRGKRLLNQGGSLSHILGGWKITSTLLAQTGQFLTPSFSGSDPSNTDTFGGRPDRIGDGNLPEGQRTIEQWFDPSAFAVPPEGRFGNAGKGFIVGPGRATLDLGLFKYFQITESGRIRVQATSTNILNHPNFNAPALNISSPGSVGRISSVYSASDFAGPREVMLGVRFEF